jgi:hypothetical protein
LASITIGVPKKEKKGFRIILELLSKNNIYVTTLALVCDQNKVLERCESRVQPKSHIHTPKSVEDCEGMSPHTPKWVPTLEVEVLMDY